MVIPVSLSVPFHIIGHWPACGLVTLGLSFPLPHAQSVVAKRRQVHVVKAGFPLAAGTMSGGTVGIAVELNDTLNTTLQCLH